LAQLKDYIVRDLVTRRSHKGSTFLRHPVNAGPSAQLRLDKGRGRLTEAVQKLTGLDDMVELGTFIQGLCHKGREYLSYKTAELEESKAEFDRQFEKGAYPNVAPEPARRSRD
jgi:hypothetical protein